MAPDFSGMLLANLDLLLDCLGQPRRRLAEGVSNKKIHRCLKRYIVRELYPLILSDLAAVADVF